MTNLKTKAEFFKYLKNTAWMMLEKFFNLGLGILASILLARSLGPEDFGIYNYALSLISVAIVFSHLGLAGIVVKELKNNPEQEQDIINTVVSLKFISACLSFSLLLIFVLLNEENNKAFFAIIIMGFAILTQPTEAINLWFQSQVKAKYASLAQIYGNALGNLAKIIVAITGMSVLFAAAAHSLQLASVAAFIYIIFIKKKAWSTHLKFSLKGSKKLLTQGGLVFLGSLSAVIYLKVDQIMLANMLGQESVGLYAAASKLSEAWYVIPTILMASIFPKMIEKRNLNLEEYEIFLQNILNFLFFMALILILFVSVYSEKIVHILYGSTYDQSASVLTIHIIATAFIFMRALVSKWIIIEELYVLSLVTQGFGAIVNIALNFYLIPIFGIDGAAWATLISYSIASYFSLAIHPKSRILFMMMTKSILYGWITTINLAYIKIRQ